MIKVVNKIPNRLGIACSGGIDSMFAISFIRKGGRDPYIIYFNHLTIHSIQAELFVEEYCVENKLKLITGKISSIKEKHLSWEEFWRNERYKFFEEVSSLYGIPIITAHNLNDVMETWIFTSLHGHPKLMPYRNKNIIRPFLMTPRKEIEDWCIRKNVKWLEDESNKDTKFARNRIRHNVLPELLKIQPGLGTVLTRLMKEKYVESL